MIGYTLVGSNDIDKAKAFYDALFATIGIGRLMDFPDGGCTWGKAFNRPMFGVGKPYDGNVATVGNGSMTAFYVNERPKVDMLHAKALELGGTSEGPPGLRDDEGEHAFYAGFVRDLDGHKICFYRVGSS